MKLLKAILGKRRRPNETTAYLFAKSFKDNKLEDFLAVAYKTKNEDMWEIINSKHTMERLRLIINFRYAKDFTCVEDFKDFINNK